MPNPGHPRVKSGARRPQAEWPCCRTGRTGPASPNRLESSETARTTGETPHPKKGGIGLIPGETRVDEGLTGGATFGYGPEGSPRTPVVSGVPDSSSRKTLQSKRLTKGLSVAGQTPLSTALLPSKTM